MLSQRYLKLKKNIHECGQELLCKLWIKTAECDFKEYDRQITKQFIHGLDNGGIRSENLRKVSLPEDIKDATSEWVMLWAQRVETQREQKRALDSMKEAYTQTRQ